MKHVGRTRCSNQDTVSRKARVSPEGVPRWGNVCSSTQLKTSLVGTEHKRRNSQARQVFNNIHFLSSLGAWSNFFRFGLLHTEGWSWAMLFSSKQMHFLEGGAGSYFISLGCALKFNDSRISVGKLGDLSLTLFLLLVNYMNLENSLTFSGFSHLGIHDLWTFRKHGPLKIFNTGCQHTFPSSILLLRALQPTNIGDHLGSCLPHCHIMPISGHKIKGKWPQNKPDVCG